MSRISIHGRRLGIDRFGHLQSDTGFKAPSLSIGPNGSEIQTAGPGSIVAGSTSATIGAGGLTTFSSTQAKAYNLAAPVTGIRKTLFCTAGTTTITHTVTVASGSIRSTAASTSTVITLNNAGDAVELIGLSTALYGVLNNQGTAALS